MIKIAITKGRIEKQVCEDSRTMITAEGDGVVDYVDAKKIIVKTKNGKDTYDLANFELANSGICSHQRPIVKPGDKVIGGDTIIADGNSTNMGELALGKNMTVALAHAINDYCSA